MITEHSGYLNLVGFYEFWKLRKSDQAWKTNGKTIFEFTDDV